MKEDKNKYKNNTLGIEITKPDHWIFLPGAWLDYSKDKIPMFKKLKENGVNPIF